MKFSLLKGVVTPGSLLVFAAALQAQQPPPAFGSGTPAPAPAIPARVVRPSLRVKPRTTASIPPNLVCRTVNYDGLDNKTQVPVFNGVTATGWYAGISIAAVPPGDPNYANYIDAPVGNTVAVFFNGQSNTIYFATPVNAVLFYYATAYPYTVTAYDANSNPITQQNVPGNWFDTPYYQNWVNPNTGDPIQLVSTGNPIASISMVGAVNNFFAIDGLTYCTAPVIDSVEMTQAIQQWESLADLKSNLTATNSPPVPIIAGKPGVMRVYLKPAFEAATINVKLAIPNVITETKVVSVAPGCATIPQRLQAQGCSSVDFYFTPLSGSWTATLTVTDPSSGTTIDSASLPFTSLDARPLVLSVVNVCDDIDTNRLGMQSQECGSVANVVSNATLLGKLSPTGSFAPVVNNNTIFKAHTNSPQLLTANWWNAIVTVLGRLYIQDSGGLAPSSITDPYTVYFGAIRPNLPFNPNSVNFQSDLGGDSHINSHEAAASSTTLSFGLYSQGVDITPDTIAHETGHTLSLTHTNSANPKNPNAPPACWAFAAASDRPDLNPNAGTDWLWPQTNNTNLGSNAIQSPARLEVPFDVASKLAMAPNVTFEIESYCHPRWIAPQRYCDEMSPLSSTAPACAPVGTGAPTSPASEVRKQKVSPHAISTQAFWMVTGSIPASGPAQLDPLFQYTLQGDISGGSGAYSLVVQSASAAVLFTQRFDLAELIPEADSTGPATETAFAQLVPVQPGAARIILEDPHGVILTYVTLGGTAPTVTITSPTAAFTGSTPIAWTITDPDSSDFTSRVYYSPNNGATWSEIGEVDDSGASLSFDFTTLPGANGTGLVRVLVSDGVNTGQATSANFTIAKKTPSLVQINSPTPNFSQAAADPLLLTGVAYDVDDGVLGGAALAWTSNLQGVLGTGSQLSVKLPAGVHTITLTATDSDNNSISTSTTVTIGDQPPLLNVSLNLLSSPPTAASYCVQANVSAGPADTNGAPLASVQYSIDGGNTYTSIPLNQLPFTFVIPGTGFIDLVFSATDTSNQIYPLSTSYFNTYSCASLTVPNVVGLTQANAATALGNAALAVGAVTMAASATVASGSIIGQNPIAGAAIAPGASDAVNLTVSAGTQVPIPNVVGQTQANATTVITGAGLAVGTVTTASSTTVTAGNVVSETPSASTPALAGATVNLVVSTGTGLAISGPAVLPVATVGYVYAATMTGAGGSGNYTWSAPGLPAGLSIDPNAGVIAGTPSSNAGSPFNVQVTITDATYSTSTNRSYSLAVNPALVITAPATLPNGVVGSAYAATTVKAAGGSGSYTWLAFGLPSGMIITPGTGAISGTPVNNLGSPFTVLITAEDSNSVVASGSYTLTINSGPLAISGPSLLPAGAVGAAYGATVTATGGSGSYTWSAIGLPPGLSIATNTGTISGTPASASNSPFSVKVTVTDSNSLTANHTYSLTVTASNPCDLLQNGNINVTDVQAIINQALGTRSAVNDLNGDGVINVVDVNIEINASLALSCTTR